MQIQIQILDCKESSFHFRWYFQTDDIFDDEIFYWARECRIDERMNWDEETAHSS